MSCSAHHSDDRAHQRDTDVTLRSQFEDFPKKLRNTLQDFISKQAKLARSRESLVIERQRLASSRTQVRAKRLEIRDAEASLMSKLRDFFNDIETQLPVSLFESYNRVDGLQNELGVLEEEFLLAERKLAGSEWGFMDEENDFYQFELLDVIENAVSEDVSPVLNQGQSLPYTDHISNLHRPQNIFASAPPFDTSSDLIRDNSGSAHIQEHTPIPLPLLQIAQPQSQKIDSRQSNETLPLVVVQPPQELSTQSNAQLRDYRTVVDELVILRKRFETLRHNRAKDSITIDDDLSPSLEVTSSVFDDSKTAQTTDEKEVFLKILEQISDREIEARRLENEAMFNDIQFLAAPRRRSDPTDYAHAAPAPSMFMGRALTETAIPMFSDGPRTKGRLRDWLLAQLREDPLQRWIYRNISIHKGLTTPVHETWEDRASSYWDIDHASDFETETDDTNNNGDGDTITSATSHGPSAMEPARHRTDSWSPLCSTQTKPESISSVLRHTPASVPPIMVDEGNRPNFEDDRSSDIPQPPTSGIDEVDTSCKTGKQQEDKQANIGVPSAFEVPTIVRTPTDKEAEQEQEQPTCDLNFQAKFSQQRGNVDELRDPRCRGPWSDVFTVNVQDTPSVMTENREGKLLKRRLGVSRIFSDIQHHRRTRSASYVLDVSHCMRVRTAD